MGAGSGTIGARSMIGNATGAGDGVTIAGTGTGGGRIGGASRGAGSLGCVCAGGA